MAAVLLALSAAGYATTLFLSRFADVPNLSGFPSLFLLIFIVTLLLSGLRNRITDEIADD